MTDDSDGNPGRVPKPSRPYALQSAVAALRRFYRPFILIQAAALLLVISYHQSAVVRSFCETLASIKLAGGLPFAALSGSLAGGVLPELFRLLGDWKRYTLAGRAAEVLFNLAFFAFNGVVIDCLYRFEAWLFGNDSSLYTIAMKTAFDQFVFNPLWVPLIIALFSWRREGFSLAATLTSLREPGFYKNKVVPLLLPVWCFWIPMVCVIYALPGPLQFVLFVLALGAWSLIMVDVANVSARARTDATAAPAPT